MDRGAAQDVTIPAPPPRPETPARWELPLPRGRTLRLGGRPLVMGVVNITPDSFSDGGLFLAPERAIERALELERAGAELLDLGAESTRPGGGVYGEGARAPAVDAEISRLAPVLEALRPRTELPISVDTRRGAVARFALEAGADLINDVSGLADPEAAEVVAETGCPVVLMHSRGDLATMQRGIHFDDLVGEVRDELAGLLARARRRGVVAEQTLLDPGIGFGKLGRHNLGLLRRLDALSELGRPLLVGASRKSFIGEITGAEPRDRMPGSLAAAAWAALHGAAVVRVHDVAATAQFLAVWTAIAESHPEPVR
ncbi:MAG: dihydropteroate synthase [Thermoanaerobaculia bacterium]|nr:dihydropteroate synthase [Thermoanaerobaculia bacterium]